MKVVIKWNKKSFDCELDVSLGPEIFKSQIYSLTGVPIERQKLMAKGAWSGVLKDDADLTMMPIVVGQQIMLMGTAETVVVPTDKPQFIEDMSGEQKAVKGAVIPAGMANLGNTCYMNATMQCFRGMSELRTVMQKVNPSSQASEFAVNLRETLNSLDRAASPVPPMQFVNMLRSRFPQFNQRARNGGFLQQDAEEFFNLVTQILLTSFGEVNENFSDYLGLDMEETLLCQESDVEPPIKRIENSNKLVCNIQGGAGSVITIDFIEEGIKLGLEGIVEKFSFVLNRNANWKKTQKISKLPKFFCVQFMRFFWKPTPESRDHTGVKCKILRPVSFSDTLDVYDFCSDALQAELRIRRDKADRVSSGQTNLLGGDGNLDSSIEIGDKSLQESSNLLPEGATGVYELMAVVTHKGRSADSGHYIGWTRQSPGSDFWWKYDDEIVTEMRTSDVLALKGNGDSDAAYLNMYRCK